MNYPTDFNVKTASKDRNDFDMSKVHVTSQDFGVMKPIEMKLCFPGDKIHLELNQKTQVLTMPAPTFGSADMILRSFFVPINNIWKDFPSFVSNQKVATSPDTLIAISSAPFMYAGDIMSYFFVSAFATAGSADDFDIKISRVFLYDDDDFNPQFTVYYRKFTFLGRKLYDFFVSLGLKLMPFVAHYSNKNLSVSGNLLGSPGVYDEFETEKENFSDDLLTIYNYAKQKISILPLLAFWKFYLDWVVPARFLSNYPQLRHIFDTQHISDISYWDMFEALSTLPVSFLQDDFFTTAFSSPYGYEDSANVSNSTSIPILANGVANARVTLSNEEGAFLTGLDSSDINQLSIKSLGALQDMVNRGKIAGSKIKDWLESTYGIKPSDEALHLSKYFGSQRVPIDFATMQTTTDTYDPETGNGALMGSLAGKADVSNNPFKVSFDVDDNMHGFFFVTSEIQVKPSYTQGLAPEFTALDRLDYFDPAFDALGVEAIPRSLLCNIEYKDYNLNNFDSETPSPEDIFGFVSTYARYKTNFDNVSGDFVIRSLNTGLDSWYLSRLFTMENLVENYSFINEKFLQAISDDTNEGYDRIFSVANSSMDHFRSRFFVNLKMSRLMKSLRDSLDFVEGGKTIQKSVNNGVQN